MRRLWLAIGAAKVLELGRHGQHPSAIAAGAMTAERVHGEFAVLIAGRIPGRRSTDEITLFDSSAVEDRGVPQDSQIGL